MFGIRRKKEMTLEQRRKMLKNLREEAKMLEEEASLKMKVKKERAEIKQLREELHPSKVKRLAQLLGKAEHGGVSAGKAFVKVHKEIVKADKKFQKEKNKLPRGFA